MPNKGKTTKNRYVTEVVEEKRKALVVYQKKTKLVSAFIQALKKHYTIYEETGLEGNYKEYDVALFINVYPEEPNNLKSNKLNLFVFLNNHQEFMKRSKWIKKNLQRYKVVNLGKNKKPINEIVKYILYQTPVPYIFDFAPKMEKTPLVIKNADPKQSFFILLRILIIAFLFFNFLYLSFFAFEWWSIYDLWNSGKKNRATLENKINRTVQIQKINSFLVNIPKNTLFWFPGIENFFQLTDTTEKTVVSLEKGHQLFTNYSSLVQLILMKNKTPGELKEAKLRIKYIQKTQTEFNSSYYEVMADWQKTNIPFFNTKKNQLIEKAAPIAEYLDLAAKINEQLPYLFGAEKPRKYLILFMNNMELRPGGGFIGSVAVASFEKLSLKELKVYDVYSLDGQLKIHLEPPYAIREYLEQPHWFLRDSNFSADFSDNAEKALKFIEEEVGWKDFDGVFGITLTAVQKTLELFPDFYLSDYEETITPDNFFLKAQTYAEKDFFAGSHSKKNFLNSVFNSLVIKLEEGSFDYWQAASIARDTFEEKFAVVYFTHPTLQAVFDNLFWTGRIVKPGCSLAENCFFDYLYVVDANLGINKSNYYIQRTIRLLSQIDQQYFVKNKAIITYTNEATEGTFPGGVYKNYLQVYLPTNTVLENVLVDNVSFTDYRQEKEFGYKKVGFFLKVLPKTSKQVVINYHFNDKFKQIDQYQLIVQKQVGSINNDFIFEMALPPELSLNETNFTPIVKENGLVYNTFLHKDRLLLIQFK